MSEPDAEGPVQAPFFVRGEVIRGEAAIHRSRDLGIAFATPAIPFDRIVTPRCEVPPLLNVPTTEIIDFLVETGQRLADPGNPFVEACFARMAETHVLPRGVVEAVARHAVAYLDRGVLEAELSASFPDPDALDRWVETIDASGRRAEVRAYAPRMLHVLPGNSPGVAIKSIAQGALVKACNLFKMSSADPFYTVAVLRTMAAIDPGHPVVRSMSAVYWSGGDSLVESVLCRPQYFDRIVAWGGGETITGLARYAGPGLQLVSFDPKTSISMIGREALASDQQLAEAAEGAAADLMMLNQEACAASRFQFVEGSQEQVDRFCQHFQRAITRRALASGDVRPLPRDLREQIEALRLLDEDYRVWGRPDGTGLVIRSTEPVDFHPSHKIANVVRVDRLEAALAHVNVATQTVGIAPAGRMAPLRDALAAAGAQRVCPLGEAGPSTHGTPWDGMYPLHRFVLWVVNERGCAPDRSVPPA